MRPSPAPRKPLRMLVVAAASEARPVLEALGDMGTVSATVEEREILAMIEAGQLDVLLVDRDLPAMQDLEMVRRVRAASRNVGIVLIGASESMRAHLQSPDRGLADAVLLRPLEPRRLRDVTESVATRISARRSTSLTKRLVEELAREDADD